MSIIIDLSKENNSSFIVRERENLSYILLNVEGDISFDIKDSGYLKLAIVGSSSHKASIKGSVGDNAVLEVYYADFSGIDNEVTTDINLDGVNSSVIWHLAALSKNKAKKKFEVSVNHNNLGTKSQIDNYGVCREGAKLNFSGIVHILNGSHQSVAHQNAKIIIFDDDTDAVAKPILKIDDNDIEASHASTVGKISDDELFYMMSRGISMEQARELITYGYLRPIVNGFDDEEIAKDLSNQVEGGF